jgi:hypothetical protein
MVRLGLYVISRQDFDILTFGNSRIDKRTGYPIEIKNLEL